jgi:hypothetical protein
MIKKKWITLSKVPIAFLAFLPMHLKARKGPPEMWGDERTDWGDLGGVKVWKSILGVVRFRFGYLGFLACWSNIGIFQCNFNYLVHFFALFDKVIQCPLIQQLITVYVGKENSKHLLTLKFEVDNILQGKDLLRSAKQVLNWIECLLFTCTVFAM